MHGIGNDYIYVNCMENELKDPSGASVAMSPRHFSVGADGLVMICRSDEADAKMRMFNADGSEGKMCGNAIRCVGKYLYDNGIVSKENISVETLSGIKYLTLHTEGGKVASVTVDMGLASFAPKDIPISKESEHVNEKLVVGDKEYFSTALSMGNPHNVIFLEEVASLDLEKTGSEFENHPMFPERVNTEFVKVINGQELEMRVWERGSGETWACGTGACAVVAAACKCGISPFNEPIKVRLIGGELSIVCKDGFRMMMTGPCEKSFDGVYEYEN